MFTGGAAIDKREGGDEAERVGQGPALAVRGVGAFQGDPHACAEGPHVGYLVGELKPSVALAVGQHRLKIAAAAWH